ncbi:MAG: NAD-binding protein [Flavobacteriaceae bacterium]|nr:NAD-binding protein [Flavobacteriaceae bacterium]
MRNIFQSKIYIALLLLVAVFLMGILGFKFISDYSWIDAIYMTVITITTVGYGEVHPLDQFDKIFTSVLILTSIFIFGYAIKVISEYILSQNNIGNLRQKRVERKIAKMHDHIIVCGYGRNGQQAVHKLLAYNQAFVVIEKEEEVVERFSSELVSFIYGNASEDEVLKRAGIEHASTLISALPSDADNLFIVLSARQMNSKLKIISRATEETTQKKLKLAGANNVIMPDKIGGEHMASLVVTPDLIEFLDNLSVSGDDDSMNVEQIPFSKVCPEGNELAIKDLDLRKKTGCSIIGYKSPNGEYIVNPEPSMVLERNSKLILIGRPFQIEKLKETYNV